MTTDRKSAESVSNIPTQAELRIMLESLEKKAEVINLQLEQAKQEYYKLSIATSNLQIEKLQLIEVIKSLQDQLATSQDQLATSHTALADNELFYKTQLHVN